LVDGEIKIKSRVLTRRQRDIPLDVGKTLVYKVYPPCLEVGRDAAYHGNLATTKSVRKNTKGEDDVRTAPERILKPSVRSSPLAVKNVCLAFSPETTTTVFWKKEWGNELVTTSSPMTKGGMY
jgi:hypothetical protein